MKKGFEFRINAFICVIIMLGFFVTFFIGHSSSSGLFSKSTENVATLTSEDIYFQIRSIFTKPINISLTMANDSLLKNFLANEYGEDNEEFLKEMTNYLDSYKKKYGYESVFLVSKKTGNYYNFDGINRVLYKGFYENDWYYDFLESKEEYSINIDNDEAGNNEITVFINCKIRDSNDEVMAVVGVGMGVHSMQRLLMEYSQKFDVNAYLVKDDGTLEISTDKTGFQNENFFDICSYPDMRDKILSSKSEDSGYCFWHKQNDGDVYVVARHIDLLSWYLIVENGMQKFAYQQNVQLAKTIVIAGLLCIAILIVIAKIIREHNNELVKFEIESQNTHNVLFQAEINSLYESIFEFDLTHNCIVDESAKNYFKKFGVPTNYTFDESIEMVARKIIKEEFVQGYLDTFSSENVLEAYENGVRSLKYETPMTDDGKNYYWLCIIAKLFFWNEDNSVRMFSFRKNINDEKIHSYAMAERMKKDSLTELYNKMATQEQVECVLNDKNGYSYAFLIFDIDDFKDVNDKYGHLVGDIVIKKFAQKLATLFDEEAVVGRIGGDEFVVFTKIYGKEHVEGLARNLVSQLNIKFNEHEYTFEITASIGIAVTGDDCSDFITLYKNADVALYNAKNSGKNKYSIF